MPFFTKRERTGFKTTGPSMTKQADAHEADINVIMDRYQKTGDPSIFMRNTGGIYADVSDAPDYQACLNTVREAQSAFDALPARIRDRFANDPAQLIAAIQDPAMHKELRELGVLEELAEAPPSSTPPAAAPTTPDPAPAAPPKA